MPGTTVPALLVEKAPQTGPVWWIPLALLVAGLLGAVGLLHRAGRQSTGGLVARVLAGLRRSSGLPAWAAASIGLSLWSLITALLGFAWDVAWHADLGRDKELFTPAHVLILVGLAGIGVSALVAIGVATLEKAPVGLRLGRLQVPWASLPLGLMGLGAVIGFPLDDYWHSVYGIDVTMWSPTHLLMIGGASLTPIATWLLLAESGVPARSGRVVRILSEALAASTLVGLSTFQLEFDMGIPQWQALYQPVLMAIAMGVGLLAAREALGPGGALRATLGFLFLRAVVALLVAPVFGLTLERFPLYLAGALAVEAVFLFGARISPMTRVLASGLLIATVGLAGEWAWTHLWGLQPWQPRLLQWWWVVIGAGLAGSLLGSALGRAAVRTTRLAAYPAVALAFLAVIALLAVPYPRGGADVVAAVSARDTSPPIPAITRDGVATFERRLVVDLTVAPPDAVQNADVFRVVAWQGGDIVLRQPRNLGGGHYVVDDPFPAGGDWKSLLLFLDGAVVSAVPIDFPADATYGLGPIPAPTSAPRASRFEPASTYLTRESHGGSALPAVLAYSTFGIIGIGWGLALIGVGTAMSRRLHPQIPLRRSARPHGA